MMRNTLLALLLLITGSSIHAQVTDFFDDGNFTTNPAWIGDDSLFQIQSGQLRLKGTVAKGAFLATAHNNIDSNEWTFLTRFTLSPSTQNFSRFYLASDVANLTGSLNGYYVQLGGVTGNTDSITLYRQNGNVRTRIIAGRPGTVSKTSNTVRIKVTRDAAGNWKLLSDTSGGFNYVEEGSAFDNNITSSAYLGWWMRYTAGNNQAFYLDEVVAGKPRKDTIPPRIDSVVLNGNNQLLIYFNEAINENSAEQPLNYALTPNAGGINSATLSNNSIVTLTFNQPFTPKTNYSFSVEQILDTSGNEMEIYTTSLFYYQPEVYDLLISEFFPDPTPVIGLPEQEFVELYNNSNIPIKLGDFTISDGGTPVSLPAVILPPDSFVIVCAASQFALFEPFGRVAPVSSLPSLNNTSDQIIIQHKSGVTVHAFTYSLTWYNDANKDDGGWSIELVNPKQICKSIGVYAASNHPNGGTPGQTNSNWSKTPDTQKPGLVSVIPLDEFSIQLVFNENLSSTTINNTNITLNPNIGIGLKQFNGRDTLVLQLLSALQNKTNYTVQINPLTDCSGNDTSIQTNFTYIIPDEAQQFDVLIHEIMADPEPAQRLPNAEYIELYNRSSNIISLKNWELADATSRCILPDYILAPDSFVIITASNQLNRFNGLSVIGVSNFPSLGNDGEALTLFNANKQVIHTVTYASDWYKDGVKKNGGWSLEMVDVQNPCGGANNWKASTNLKGGTPAKPNSVRGLNRDEIAPKLLRAYTVDSSTIQLYFDEALDSTSTKNKLQYQIIPDIGIDEISGVANEYKSVRLLLSQKLNTNTLYEIRVDSVQDCANNPIENFRSAEFGLPEAADSGDLVLNEVLFNAKTGAYDFVELYNNSNKLIDVKNLLLANRNNNNELDNLTAFAAQGFMIKPKSYVVITELKASLQQQYFCKYPEHIIESTLPAMSDDAGEIILLNVAGKILDDFTYDDDMHFGLLDDKDGVSLERIDFTRSTSDRTNWTSAASSVGYATPTYQNSQYLQTERAETAIQLQPQTFSPDGDGYNDVMNINYNMREPGYTANLWIYDAAGRAVKQLLKNEILGTSGTYTWDGITANGQKAPIGIYVFYFEVFNLKGEVKTYKTVGVVAGRL